MSLQPYEIELAKQNIVPLADGTRNASRIIIGEDGVVTFNTWQKGHLNTRPWMTNQFLDLNDKDNKLVQAVNPISNNALKDLSKNQPLQDLLAKNKWDYDDRCAYESYISAVISKHHDEIMGHGTVCLMMTSYKREKTP